MKRRDFMRLGAAGMAGASLTGSLSPSRQENPTEPARQQQGSLKKGYMIQTFPDRDSYTLLEQFRMLRDAGFEGVEPLSGFDRSEVLEAKEATGLEIPSVCVSTHWTSPLSSPDPAVRKAGLDGLETALYDAHEYGASTILLVPGVVNSEVSYDDVYRRSQLEIRKMVPLAEELGVTIAIENVWNHFLLSPMEAVQYVDEFRTPQVGWYFDIGNILNYGWPQQWIRILGERIAMIHIKEFSRSKRDDEGLWAGFRVDLMEGDNEWEEIMQALRDVGYSGYGIVEPAYRDPETPHDEWLRNYIAGRMDQIFSL